MLLEEDLAYLAANTIGFVGADLQMVCSEAIMEARPPLQPQEGRQGMAEPEAAGAS